jgi:myo-inositol-1(or 4)-monophosphatase
MSPPSAFHNSPTTAMAAVSSAAALASAAFYIWKARGISSLSKSSTTRNGIDSANGDDTEWLLYLPDELKSCEYAHELEVAMHLAYQAGSNMMSYYDAKGTAAESDHDLDIATKGQPENFCTKIDVENERLVTEGLLLAFPTHAVIGEESTGTGTVPALSNDTPTWIVDPIDGTTNFAAGLPLSCVSLGLCVDGRPVMGVVYAPMTHEWYVGVRQMGAYRNGVRIAPRPVKPLSEAVVCFEFGYAKSLVAIDKLLRAVQGLLLTGCRATRQLGSGVLDLCYVATGRLDAVYAGVAGEGWKPWDYCAGLVIAEEAGCVLEAIDQKEPGPYDLYAKSILCATSRELLEEVRQAIKMMKPKK